MLIKDDDERENVNCWRMDVCGGIPRERLKSTNTEGRKKDQQFLYYAENHIVREKITAAIDQ